MKNELKALYKKEPKLAKEVAKVLGFKIKTTKANVKTKTKTVAEKPMSKVMKMGLGAMLTKKNQASLGADLVNQYVDLQYPIEKIKSELKQTCRIIEEGGRKRLDALMKMITQNMPKDLKNIVQK